MALEIKAANTVSLRDIQGMQNLQAAHPEIFKLGLLLYNGTRTRFLATKIYALPLAALAA